MKQSDNLAASEHQLRDKADQATEEPAEVREIAFNRSHEEKEEQPDLPNSLPVDSQVNLSIPIETMPNFSVISLGGKRRKRTIFGNSSSKKLENNPNPQQSQNEQQKKIAVDQIRPMIGLASSMPEATIQCNFCAELLKEDKFQRVFECPHSFCKGCLKIYVQTQIKNFKIVHCPNQQCVGGINEQGDYYKSLGFELRQKYEIVKFRANIQKNEKMAICPDENCKKGFIEMVEGSKTGQCKQCHVVYCLNCRMKSHHGKCEKFQDILLKDKFKYKKCGGCKRIVERNQGCPHMTCKCGYQFCYYCAGKWEVPHRCLRYLAGGQLITDKLYDGLKCLRHQDYEYEYTFLGFLTKVPFYLVTFLLLLIYSAWCIAVLGLLIAGILVCSFFSGYVALQYKLCRDGNSCGKIGFIILLILLPLGFLIGWVVVFVYCVANAMPKYCELALSARLFPCYLC